MSGWDRLDVSTEALASLCSEFGVLELSVFGSAVSEDFSADSDVDLLVVFDRPVGLFHLMRLQHQLEDLLARRVDLVPKPGLKPQVRDQVLASAHVVYAA